MFKEAQQTKAKILAKRAQFFPKIGAKKDSK
jgi:hypothetical protein